MNTCVLVCCVTCVYTDVCNSASGVGNGKLVGPRFCLLCGPCFVSRLAFIRGSSLHAHTCKDRPEALTDHEHKCVCLRSAESGCVIDSALPMSLSQSSGSVCIDVFMCLRGSGSSGLCVLSKTLLCLCVDVCACVSQML